MSPNSLYTLSSRKKTLVEQMFEKHGYSEQDIDDFFEIARMDRRFEREKIEIRKERRERRLLKVLEPQTD